MPPTQPDKCSKCPLLGLRPESELTKGERQAYCCIGIYGPLTDYKGEPILDENENQIIGFPPLTSKGIERSAEAYRKKQRRLHRPCDDRWEVGMSLPTRQVPVTMDAFRERRMAYELEMEKQHYKSLFKRI